MSTGNDANFESLMESFQEKIEKDENKNVETQEAKKDSTGGKPKELKGKDGDKGKMIAMESEESSGEKDADSEDDEPSEVKEQEAEDIDEEDELFELLINLPLQRMETFFDEKVGEGPLPFYLAYMILDKMDSDEKRELLDKLRAESPQDSESEESGEPQESKGVEEAKTFTCSDCGGKFPLNKLSYSKGSKNYCRKCRAEGKHKDEGD